MIKNNTDQWFMHEIRFNLTISETNFFNWFLTWFGNDMNSHLLVHESKWVFHFRFTQSDGRSFLFGQFFHQNNYDHCHAKADGSRQRLEIRQKRTIQQFFYQGIIHNIKNYIDNDSFILNIIIKNESLSMALR